jgi:MFS family permease
MAATADRARAWSASIDRSGWRALAASWMGWMFDGYETYALILVMGVAARDLLPPDAIPHVSVYMGGLLAVTLLGWATGGVIAGVLADYIGRKRMLMLSILWYSVFAGLTALSHTYWYFLTFRFLTGLGLGAEWGPGTAIVAEFWPASSRGRAAGVLHAANGVGLFLASGMWLLLNPLGPSSWRYMFVIGILPALLLLYVRRWVHDPTLWVAADRLRREARKRVEMGVGSQQDRELAQFTITRVLSDPELRRRVGLLLLMSLSTVVGSWSVSSWIPQYAAQVAINGGYQSQLSASLVALMFSAGAIAGCVVLGWLADTFGRKPATWLYYLGALGLSLCFFLLVHDKFALLVMAAVNGFFTNGQFAWMTIYLPELFPTRVRGSAISLVFDSSRSVAAFGPLLAGWLISSFGSIGSSGDDVAYLCGGSGSHPVCWAGDQRKAITRVSMCKQIIPSLHRTDVLRTRVSFDLTAYQNGCAPWAPIENMNWNRNSFAVRCSA